MSYIITKTNGQTLSVIGDAEVDINSTSLTLIGKNYAGYGLVLDQNFVRLLENFSNSSQPDNALQGQLWFNNSAFSKKLNVCYDGVNFKPIANLTVKDSVPAGSVIGDLWWDTRDGRLKAFDGSIYQSIGPVESTTVNAKWSFENETPVENPNAEYTVIKAEFGNKPFLTITSMNTGTFTPIIDSDLRGEFINGVKKGITLAGCDSNGSSEVSENYFWGTASDALKAKAKVISTSSNKDFFITFVSTATSGAYNLQTTSTFFFNPFTNVLNATATAARYADLAERYEADAEYTPGTVLVVGGDKEVTTTNLAANPAVAGVVSFAPAYMMNSEAGDDKTHPYVALKGRVKCKVYGPVTKGDLLVTSRHPGYACAYVHGDHPKSAFAVALEHFSGEFGMIEVKI